MQKTAFDPHARILHSGQYKIKQTSAIDVPIKSFDSADQAEKVVQQRIHEMNLEIQELEAKITQKRLQSKNKADEILEQVQDEAKKVMEEAEQHAFNQVQRSVEEKEQLLQKTEEEVDRMKMVAESEGNEIKDKARKEAVEIQDDAKKEGYKKGLLDGIDQGLSDVKFAIDRLHSIVAETARERERILIHSESQVIDLVLSMVNKVVKKLSVEHQDVVIENVKAGLELLRGVMTIFIRVSPHDFNYVNSFREELIQMIESRSDIKFIEDPTIDPGGVYIETDMGDVDVTIRSQLEELENQMRFYMPVKVKSPEEKRRERENSEVLRKNHEDKVEDELKKTTTKTPFAKREEYQSSSHIIDAEKDDTKIEENKNDTSNIDKEDNTKTESTIDNDNDTMQDKIKTEESRSSVDDSMDILEDISAEITKDDSSVQDPVIESYKENIENEEETSHDDIIG